MVPERIISGEEVSLRGRYGAMLKADKRLKLEKFRETTPGYRKPVYRYRVAPKLGYVGLWLCIKRGWAQDEWVDVFSG